MNELGKEKYIIIFVSGQLWIAIFYFFVLIYVICFLIRQRILFFRKLKKIMTKNKLKMRVGYKLSYKKVK